LSLHPGRLYREQRLGVHSAWARARKQSAFVLVTSGSKALGSRADDGYSAAVLSREVMRFGRRLRPLPWIRRLAAAALGACVFAASPDPGFAQAPKEPPSTPSAELEEAARLEKDVERLHADGKYAEALQAAERVLSLREGKLGPDHPLVASAASDLGGMYVVRGDLLRAEALLNRAVTLLEKAPPGHERTFAIALHNLSIFYKSKGEYDRAKLLLDRAVAVQEKVGGPDDPGLGTLLRASGRLLHTTRQFAAAEKQLKRALAIHEKAKTDREIINDLIALGELARSQGQYYWVEKHYNRAGTLIEKVLGRDHPDRAKLLLGIAVAYRADKQYDKAAPFFEEALGILEKALGQNHPDVASALNDWALLEQAKGNIGRVVQLRTRASEIEEHHLDLLLATGSEDEKQAYATKLYRRAEEAVSLHVWAAPNDKAAARLALTLILQRKGRVLDAVTEGMSVLRQRLNPEDQRLLDELGKVRSELATKVIRGPGNTDRAAYLAAVQALSAQERELETRASARSAEFRAVSQPVTIEAVQQAIPEGAALVEIFRYRYVDARAYSDIAGPTPRHYVAYVLRRTGEPAWTSLRMDASSIDSVVRQVRKAFASPAEKNYPDPASRLDNLVMLPIARVLGDTREVILSPDGDLNLVPFAALVDGTAGRHRIDQLSFSYLTSGRDLLRFATSSVPKGGAMIVANPDYDAGSNQDGPGADRAGERSLRGVSLAKAHFDDLPGTKAEAQAIAPLLPDAAVLMGASASEAAIKKAHGPKILHIATHGFFLTDKEKGAGASARGLELDAEPLLKGSPSTERTPPPSLRIVNPLLRSGIALSGANVRRNSDDDGVLTALEATGLDLTGTKLVVLSACETGVGDPTVGEGVYGLRRALVIAGAETQVMSLWKVDDEATRDLMTGYYKNILKHGAGRAEGMRQAQLSALSKSSTSHPYYWAAFIVSGASGPLQPAEARTTEGPAPAPPKVIPGARGCGCEVASNEREIPFGWIALLAFFGRRNSLRLSKPPRRQERQE
jgi:CHAT domain-containing protein/Tfp pilus assembly protein PilF